MPKNSTIGPNDKKEHDNLHTLFVQDVLCSCWCTCRRCWDPQKVFSICINDPNRTSIQAESPMIVTDEDRRRAARV